MVEAKECYGTSSLEHPTVASLVQEIGKTLRTSLAYELRHHVGQDM